MEEMSEVPDGPMDVIVPALTLAIIFVIKLVVSWAFVAIVARRVFPGVTRASFVVALARTVLGFVATALVVLPSASFLGWLGASVAQEGSDLRIVLGSVIASGGLLIEVVVRLALWAGVARWAYASVHPTRRQLATFAAIGTVVSFLSDVPVAVLTAMDLLFQMRHERLGC